MTSLMGPASADLAEQEWLDEPCCAEALREVKAAFDAFTGGDERWDDVRTVGHLGHSHVAYRLLDVVGHDHEPHVVVAFAEFLTQAVREREVGPARLLAGLAHLADGDALAAERCLDEALGADPALAPAASELSLLALDRGDLDRTATLLARACCSPVNARWLDDQRRRAGGRDKKVGRNELCPCGSGRKSKRCCDGRGTPSLKVRSELMMVRLALFAAPRNGWSRLLAMAAASPGPDMDEGELEERTHDQFLLDLAVFEGGLADEYLAERGPLLPDDERDLLTRAIAEPRRLWKLLEVDEGTGMRLQLAEGPGSPTETLWLDERSGSRGRCPGEQILARVLSCENTWISLGAPIIVAPLHRRRTRVLLRLSPGAIDYAAWYGTLLAPPTLQNRESEPLVLCRAELAPASPAEVADVLDDLLVGEGEGDNTAWHEVVDLGGGDTVLRGTVSLAGDRVVVTTNSEARHDRLIARLTAALDAAIVADERQPAMEAVREHRARQKPGGGEAAADEHSWRADDPDIPPEAATALEDYMI
ncbi:MAG: SEC-C metal-binding domain-containing protein, partial [Acidimicrobiales bacterium]